MCALLVSWKPGHPHRVGLEGELDLATAPELTGCVAEIHGSVELDCSRLTFIDAAGVSAILRAHGACEARGDRLVVVAPSRWVLRVLEALELATVLHVRRDRCAVTAEASGEQ